MASAGQCWQRGVSSPGSSQRNETVLVPHAHQRTCAIIILVPPRRVTRRCKKSCQGSRTRRFTIARGPKVPAGTATMEEESPALRSIEAFFLNSAFVMESQKLPSATSKETSYPVAMSAYHENNFEYALPCDRQPSSATIKNVVDEPVFWHGYTSEEEAASPIGTDEGDDTDSARFSNLPVLSPTEEHKATIVSQAHQLCTHAQAVTILSAGRPRVVNVPKLIIEAPRHERDPSIDSLPNKLRLKTASVHLRSYSLDAPNVEHNVSDYSHKDSLDSNGTASLFSTAPSSLHEQSSRPGRMSVSSRHVPLMEAARHIPLLDAARLASPISPTYPSSPAGLKNSYTWSQPVTPTSAPSISRSSVSQSRGGVLSALKNRFESSDSGTRRASKVGSSNIARIGKNILRRDTLEVVENEYASKMAEPRHASSQPASPITRHPVQSSLNKSGRMVARGANERAPVLTLPSCPDEFSRSFESEWPLWTEPTQTHSARITTVG